MLLKEWKTKPFNNGLYLLGKQNLDEFNGIRMTVNYNVTNKKTGDIVIDAFTKHCFTDRTLRPINMKKKNIEIYNIFEKLYEENKN